MFISRIGFQILLMVLSFLVIVFNVDYNNFGVELIISSNRLTSFMICLMSRFKPFYTIQYIVTTCRSYTLFELEVVYILIWKSSWLNTFSAYHIILIIIILTWQCQQPAQSSSTCVIKTSYLYLISSSKIDNTHAQHVRFSRSLVIAHVLY